MYAYESFLCFELESLTSVSSLVRLLFVMWESRRVPKMDLWDVGGALIEMFSFWLWQEQDMYKIKIKIIKLKKLDWVLEFRMDQIARFGQINIGSHALERMYMWTWE